MAGVSITNLTQPIPKGLGSSFIKVAKEVLPGWDLSLVFVGPTKARALNVQLRGKDYIPNVLSYVVGEKSGEIIICPSEAAKQVSSFQLPLSSFLLLLFIHGALHIKG
ncbi:rRNA maturation RNase YbeY, partial [Candidatus Kaiserbacteria bacterium RIFCSPLOWO2_02_FULL_55_12]